MIIILAALHALCDNKAFGHSTELFIYNVFLLLFEKNHSRKFHSDIYDIKLIYYMHTRHFSYIDYYVNIFSKHIFFSSSVIFHRQNFHTRTKILHMTVYSSRLACGQL